MSSSPTEVRPVVALGVSLTSESVVVDLADGRTGPDAARWLKDRKIPCLFLPGQEHNVADAGEVVLGTISKPVSLQSLADGLLLVP